MSAVLHSVNLAVDLDAPWTPAGWSGIDKRPVDGRVLLTSAGVTGDRVADSRNHGGPDKAVYAYAREDASWWAADLGQDVAPGGFGENLSTVGLDVTGAVIGEHWVIGSAVLQVCQPRTPCHTFAGFRQVPDLVTRFTKRAAPGAYLRVLRDGEVTAGDRITVRDRPAHGVTVGETFRALHLDPLLLPRLLDVDALPGRMRAKVRRRLGQP